MRLRQNLLLASKSPGVDVPFDDVKCTWLKGSLTFRKFRTWNIFNLATDQKPFFLLNTTTNIQPVNINATQLMIVIVDFVYVDFVINQLNNDFNA